MPHHMWTPRCNGSWILTDHQDFWQIGLTVQNPEIPNYPLETPAAPPDELMAGRRMTSMP